VNIDVELLHLLQQLPPQGYSDAKTVTKLFLFSRSKRWYEIRAGRFPPPLYDGCRQRWLNAELIAHGETLARGEIPIYRPRAPRRVKPTVIRRAARVASSSVDVSSSETAALALQQSRESST